MDRTTLWRKANPERAREISRNSYAKRKAEGKPSAMLANRKHLRLTHPERTLFNYAKLRARNLGIPFSIDLADVQIPEVCPVLGVPLVLDDLRHPHGPSLDKVVPSKGYVKGNVAVISMRANRLKSNCTLDELERLVAFVKSF